MKTKTLESLIKSKKFEYVNPNITTENFPPEPIRSSEYKIFHFNRYISTEDAVKEMKKEDWLPANIYELLRWADWNEKDYVVAPGSVCEVSGDRYVAYLDRDGSGRDLRLGWFVDDWRDSCRFLAVRNSALSPSVPESSALESFDLSSLEIGYKGKMYKLIEVK